MIIRRFLSVYGRSIRPSHRIPAKQNIRNARFYATETTNSESASASQNPDTTESIESNEREGSKPAVNATKSQAQIAPAEDKQAETDDAKEEIESNTTPASQPTEAFTGYKAKSREQLRQERSTVEGKRRSILHNGISTATPIDAEGVARVIMQRIEHTTVRINPTARKPRRLPLDQEAKDMMINRLAKGEHDEQGILRGETVYEQKTLNDIARSTLLNPTYGSSDAERFRMKVQNLLPTARQAAQSAAKKS